MCGAAFEGSKGAVVVSLFDVFHAGGRLKERHKGRSLLREKSNSREAAPYFFTLTFYLLLKKHLPVAFRATGRYVFYLAAQICFAHRVVLKKLGSIL